MYQGKSQQQKPEGRANAPRQAQSVAPLASTGTASPGTAQLADLATAADAKAAASPVAQLQSRAAAASGLPQPLSAGIEHLSGLSMQDVRVHYNSSEPGRLGALAHAQGADIHLGPGQAHLLPHEAWHVVQQAQGRVAPTYRAGGIAINDDPSLEQEATVMGARALGASGRTPPTQLRRAALNRSAPVQYAYADLADIDRHRVDIMAEAEYARQALVFETGMAIRIARSPTVAAMVNYLLSRVRQILDAWAVHTSTAQAQVYEEELGWSSGDNYFGAFFMAADNIRRLFADASNSYPLRSKLKIVYNAVRNNNLAKWLRLAQAEMARAARGDPASDQRIQTRHRYSDPKNTHATVITQDRKKTLTPGFAAASGLDLNIKSLSKEDLGHLESVSRQEKVKWTKKFNEGLPALVDREVFDNLPDGQSAVLVISPETQSANSDRESDASKNLTVGQQRLVTKADLDAFRPPHPASPSGLTMAESHLLMALSKTPPTKIADITNYPASLAGGAKIPWQQGGEYFDVTPGSVTTREAAKIKARLEAGISGSTDLMMQAGHYLGVRSTPDKQALRLALAGWMMANRDHSFYEVFKAAETRGVRFYMDPDRPGMEYSHPQNLAPMAPADFAGILTAPGKPSVFPDYFLSTEYKSMLAATLPVGRPKDSASLGDTLVKELSVTRLNLTTLTERDRVLIEALDRAVQAASFSSADSAVIRHQGKRRIKAGAEFQAIGASLGQGQAEMMLNRSLAKRHSTAKVALDLPFTRLAEADVPNRFMNAPAMDLGLLDSVRAGIEAEVNSIGGPVSPVPYVVKLRGRLPIEDRRQLVHGLIAHYCARLSGAAASAKRDALLSARHLQLERLAQRNLTTATMFHWGTPENIKHFIDAPSLFEGTAFVTSTQGRGVYLMPTIWDGQGYGNDPGKRLMVVEMRGVPTLQLMDDPVQHALATAMPTLADHKGTTSKPDALQELGAYDNRIRGEYLLKYTDKQYRLSTKKDVRVHDNLKRLPESLLREAYHKLTSTGARVNFVKQMIDSGFPKDFFSVPKAASSSSAGIPAPPPMPPKKQP